MKKLTEWISTIRSRGHAAAMVDMNTMRKSLRLVEELAKALFEVHREAAEQAAVVAKRMGFSPTSDQIEQALKEEFNEAIDTILERAGIET